MMRAVDYNSRGTRSGRIRKSSKGSGVFVRYLGWTAAIALVLILTVSSIGSWLGSNRSSTLLLSLPNDDNDDDNNESLTARKRNPRQQGTTTIRTRTAEQQMGTTTDNNNVMERLSASPITFITELERLYKIYGHEIKHFRPEMRTWCENTKSCKFCDFEIEMLYMLIREKKPQNVFEMAPNRGYSSHWILYALTQNANGGHLWSYDIHDASVKVMTDKFKSLWTFTKGDYVDLLQTGELVMDEFDFLFVDALHTEEFSRTYCQKLFQPHKRYATVAIHDIAAGPDSGGRESAEVYKYMAFASNRIGNVFTMSKYTMPNMNYPLDNAVQKVNELRSLHGIIQDCRSTGLLLQANNEKCKNALHDPLYFENGDSPAIFFELFPPAVEQ